VLTVGCAEINPFEVPGKVLNHPLGTESIRTGSTKVEVIKEWGRPDIINKLGAQDETGTQVEEWIYKARRITPVSIDAGYLSKNKYLYFDGDHLTLISNSPRQQD
ncbi:MAG: hypothetical protein L6309_06395, partial [Candidatus Omnitrophica bacterium]|nr:hypothetical protein [Candidatus Omnitrophota bacterium]